VAELRLSLGEDVLWLIESLDVIRVLEGGLFMVEFSFGVED
jgi:hypothetical protein